jgi:tetratricopeptide (TPR) repeat protein
MANDSDTKDAIAHIKHLLSEARFAEAFDRSAALTRAESGNAEGWWRLTLAAKGLGRWEDARNAVKKTIDLVPRSPIVWGTYGDILEALEKHNEARKAFEMSIKIDPDYDYGYLSLLYICDRTKEYDDVISYGLALDRIGQVNSHTLDKIASAFWYKNNFQMSLHYFTKSATLEPEAFRYGNLGLLYERPELAQYLDASDAYRRALMIEPGNERCLQASSRLSEKLSASAYAVKGSGTRILDKTEFHRFYVNPFVLLGCDVHSDIDDHPTKAIHKLKKALIQESDLEDGHVETLGGRVLDKSRALSLCDELLDDNTKTFHWIIFQDERLCDFLHTGDIALFTYDENYFPIDTLNELDDSTYLSWLSAPFSRQYDLVLSRAVDQNNLTTIGALLAGRRYVTRQDEDVCFAGASRLIGRRMELIRNAEKEASSKKPSLPELSTMLIGPVNPQALVPLFNLLPAHFRSFNDEAGRLLLSIAVDCYNKHSDPDLSREVLELAKAFAFVSVDVKHRIERDERQIAEIIAKERKHEVRLTLGGEPLEITREGVRKGTMFIASKDIKAVRWGAAITGQRPTYEFYFSVLSTQVTEIAISWSTSIDIDKSTTFYSQIIEAMFVYALPPILKKIDTDLDSDKGVVIGSCDLRRSHVVIAVAGWFGTKRYEVPWSRVHIDVANGQVIISDRADSKVRTALSARITYNAVAIGLVAASRGKQQ